MVSHLRKALKKKINHSVNPRTKSLRGLLLLFIEPFVAGVRDSEKYFNPDITKVRVTINGSPGKIYIDFQGKDGPLLKEQLVNLFQHKEAQKPVDDADSLLPNSTEFNQAVKDPKLPITTNNR